MVERALMSIYGGSEDFANGAYGSPKWDIYNVQGAGASIQREPRVLAGEGDGLGGLATAAGVPNYDAVIWLQGTFDAYCWADTTRIELKAFLDHGGKLFSTGDEVAYFLGSGGQNADSTIGFLAEYLGISFPTITDDETLDRVLDVEGVAGTSLAGLKMGLYGECPGRWHAFDKLTESTEQPGIFTNTTLATYQFGDAATNGRAAIIKNRRLVGGGVAVHCGFAVEALVSTNARACLLSKVLTMDFGLAAPYSGCFNSGTDAPALPSNRFGFDLSPASPSPFRRATTVRFSVPGRMRVSLAVYDVLGRKVRTLMDETLDRGVFARDWDGLADDGTRVPSGVYFTRMAAGDWTATRKTVVLR
jgi:hypothetical protein